MNHQNTSLVDRIMDNLKDQLSDRIASKINVEGMAESIAEKINLDAIATRLVHDIEDEIIIRITEDVENGLEAWATEQEIIDNIAAAI